MIKVEGISVRQGKFSLLNVSFELSNNDYFMILGESGAGKSMLLKTLAGILKAREGKIFLSGKDITLLKPNERGIGLVHQTPMLFPHLSVKANLKFGMSSSYSKKQKDDKINAIAREFDIEKLLDRFPKGLSGGEQQRVSLARTLLAEPKLILLDEPLNGIDTIVADEIKVLLRQISRKGIPIIHVTHRFSEVLSLAKKVMILANGEVVQSGTVSEVFNNPESEFVARLGGVRNFFEISEVVGRKIFLKGTQLLNYGNEVLTSSNFVSVSPNDIIVSNEIVETSMINRVEGIVKDIHELISGGIEIRMTSVSGQTWYAIITLESLNSLKISIGSAVYFHFKASAIRCY